MKHNYIFDKHIAQTKNSIFKINVEKAEGIYIWDKSGKKYIDFLSGIAVSNLGHRHPNIIKAINEQLNKYLHVMVYGEYIQTPQTTFAKLLTDNLPDNLSVCFYVNSGSEATDGAIKLARKYTGRSEIIVFKNTYHGSTLGSISLLSNEKYKKSYLPLIPDIKFLNFNDFDDLNKISEKTACVLTEPIQSAAGINMPKKGFLNLLKEKCNKNGALLILDEIQSGFGRTGKLFAFEHYNIIPDILILAKGAGGGMPLGLFVSSEKIMQCFDDKHPLDGHATTFGGHPVSCAAAYASLKTILDDNIMENVIKQSKILFNQLEGLHGIGFFTAINVANNEIAKQIVINALENGILLNWFLFNNKSLQIAPPLTIIDAEINESIKLINKSFPYKNNN